MIHFVLVAALLKAFIQMTFLNFSQISEVGSIIDKSLNPLHCTKSMHKALCLQEVTPMVIATCHYVILL